MHFPFNWEIARHPGNWITVTLMVMIGFVGFDILLKQIETKETDK